MGKGGGWGPKGVFKRHIQIAQIYEFDIRVMLGQGDGAGGAQRGGVEGDKL